MPVTDPVADMLTRIRNALVIKRESVEMPSSKMKLAIAQILQTEGYIRNFEVVEESVGSTLKIKLKYSPDGTAVISGLKKISKPGLRIYARKEQIPQVLGGLGIAIISTSKGVITDAEARKNNVGGEVLAYVW
ncbi:MAG: 30S ribosomal protein S8 [Christensenellaceae bacterium]|nr:30S ribosomal protein S8 [Christensenellaceae bacterium]MBR3843498.1 30S ribosomal protein S8 [Christensenellaceae bacterium]